MADQPNPTPTPAPTPSAATPSVPNPASEPDEVALAAAQAAIAMARQANDLPATPAPSTTPSAATFPSFDNIPSMRMPEGMDLLSDVNLNVKIELGRTKMLLEDVLKLGEGTVVELDKLAGDPVDIYVNDRPVARGEVLVLNDNFCVRISEILNKDALDKPQHRR
ncbi:MAG: flagellar motor switch protein FliN [Phycisphaerales bacterium]